MRYFYRHQTEQTFQRWRAADLIPPSQQKAAGMTQSEWRWWWRNFRRMVWRVRRGERVWIWIHEDGTIEVL